MTVNEIFTLIKDIILSIAAIVGALVAFKGLNTWKLQHQGQSEYELSRRILVTLFKYRDAISAARHPAIFSYEMPAPSENESKNMSQNQIQFYGHSKAYQARWDKVQEQRTNLYADLLESEAIWDDELKKLFKVLFNLEYELLTNIQHHINLINPDIDEHKKEAIRNIDKNKRDILYDNLSEEGDEYRKDFLLGVEEIEKYLKPKLSHKPTK